MAKNSIKELLPNSELYNGSISEKDFVKSIKGCKTIELIDVEVIAIPNEKEVETKKDSFGLEYSSSLFDDQVKENNVKDNQKESDDEDIVITGQFKLKVSKKTLSDKDKLNSIIDRLDNIEKNTLTQEQLIGIVSTVVDVKVTPKFDEVNKRINHVNDRVNKLEVYSNDDVNNSVSEKN